MSSDSFCASLGLDYDCETPLPSSAFAPTRPLCGGLAEYVYEPANCDPGFWCGCSSVDATECFPSNDTSVTRWGGRFTTTNMTTGETIVLTGSFDGDDNKCPTPYYCPGRDNVWRCPDLCEPGKLCADPSELLPCPKGYYCPVGSSVPMKCEGLEGCNEEGQRRFEVGLSSLLLFIILVVSVAYLYVGSYLLKRNARQTMETKMELKKALQEEERSQHASRHVRNSKKQEQAPAGDQEPPKILCSSIASGDREVDADASESLHFTAKEINANDSMDQDEVPEASPASTLPPLPAATATESFESGSPPPKQKRRRSTLTPPEFTIDIEFDRLSLTIPNVGTIMRGVTGKIPHGSLTAVMGPSGAGKTTFLNIVSGKIDRSGGTLKVNGEEKELTNFREDIGFVPQEDVMLRELSVDEIITHSALMRLPVNWSHAKKLSRVDEVIQSLEIDHIRDSIVGDEHRRGVSGGQRKRVNIGMEMVVKPSLLCLDEPTSGLDSTTSYTVINSLKEMAYAGANVITVLHQPKYEVFELFDNLLLLGKGGMTVYYGPTGQMTEYFKKRGFSAGPPPNVNPADWVMDVLSGVIPHDTDPNFDKEDLFEAWMCASENPDAISAEEAAKQMEQIRAWSSKEGSNEKAGFFTSLFVAIVGHLKALATHLGRDFASREKTRQTPGIMRQTALLFKRTALQRLRSPFTTVLNIILMVLAGSVIPSLTPDDVVLYVGIPRSLSEDGASEGREAYLRQNVNPADFNPTTVLNIYLFLLIVSCLSVNVLGAERTVFFRDTSTGQSVFAYWLAKTTEMMIWIPIFTCAFVLMGYSGESWFLQPLSSYWLFTMLDLLGFYGFGMVASLLVGPGSAALTSLVFGLITIIIFSGSVNAYGDESGGFQTFITFWFMFWSTQGICNEEYAILDDRFDTERLNALTPDSENTDFGAGGSDVGAGIGFGFDLDSSFARNVGFCALTAFAWQILALWTLKTKDHKKHR